MPSPTPATRTIATSATSTAFRPIVIECIINALNPAFLALFQTTLDEIHVLSPVLIALKQKALADTDALAEMCTLIARRRSAGGDVAFFITSKRYGRMLMDVGIPSNFIVTSYSDESRRRILLAQGHEVDRASNALSYGVAAARPKRCQEPGC